MALSREKAQRALLQEVKSLQKREEIAKGQEYLDKEIFEIKVEKTLETTILVLAEDLQRAEEIAKDMIDDISLSDFECTNSDVFDVQSADPLHPDNANEVPFGTDGDLTCRQIYELQQNGARDPIPIPDHPKQQLLF